MLNGPKRFVGVGNKTCIRQNVYVTIEWSTPVKDAIFDNYAKMGNRCGGMIILCYMVLTTSNGCPFSGAKNEKARRRCGKKSGR
jgi:hypothetical protein